MEDQLDEELKNRIKKVFDEYDDPSADEGWIQLREKFPATGNRRRILPLFWWSAAALLLLALGLGIWKYAGNKPEQNLAGIKKVKPAPAENLQALKPAAVKPDQNAASATTSSARPGSPLKNLNNTAATRARLLPVIPFNPTIVNKATTNADTTGKPSNQAIAAAETKVNRAINTNAQPGRNADTSRNAINQTPQNQLAVVQPNSQSTLPAKANSPGQSKTGAASLANNKPAIKKTNDLGPRVRLGVYAASFVNYAKGSTNQTNAGAGFSAEIRIAKNLKVVTGLTLAKNSLSYNGGVPSDAVSSNLFAPAGLGSASVVPSAATYSAHAAITVASAPAFENYGVSMFNIDVPVNLKYDFNLRKTSFYLMAGLSSGTFANETYTYYYNYPALPSPSLQAPHSLSSQKSFDNFYFGKMLNIAVGYGYPIGRNHLILEPFLKAPLGGLGSQNIRFGSGGINLKLNFPTK
ncbi:MAG TPA: hypothetical protein VFE53_19810 [Mucilaginibacter sp.]|jgi:hypothetical protein|nr:hypothetical protein [Mucilaginibacter sp.]